MRKGKRRNTALFLVFCMVLSMMSAIPARAAGDEDGEPGETQEELSGLLAVQWLSRDWDNDGVVHVENNHPVDPAGNPISYTDYKDVSIPGAALWIDYKDTNGTVPVSADELTVKYFGTEDPRENETAVGSDAGSIEPHEVQTSEGERSLVLFEPEGMGFYSFSYNECKTNDLIVYVDYPEIGIYSMNEQDANYLYPANDWVEEQSFNYTGLKGKSDNKIYVNLYNRYDADSIELTGYTLSLWDEEGTELDSETDKEQFEEYMSVEQMDGDSGWYEITFHEALSSVDGFGLSINGEKKGKDEDGNETTDPIGAYLEGSFRQSDLYVTCEGADLHSGEGWLDWLAYPGGINPEAAELRFVKFEQDTETGIIKEKDLTLTDKNQIEIKALHDEWDENDEFSGWKEMDVDIDDYCDYDVTEGGALKIQSYYQQVYKITIDNEGSVLVFPYMDTIEFFGTPERPDDPEKIEHRICTAPVDEGKTKMVYVLAYMNDGDFGAANMDEPEIKATLVEDGTLVNDYIDIKWNERVQEVTETEGENVEIGYDGYPIEITDKAEKDFYITVTAKSPFGNDEGEYEFRTKKLLVEINKGSSLTVKNQPKKTVYTEGETFDPTGMTIEMAYEDESIDPIEIKDYTITPAGPLKTTDKYVTVEYHGKTTTQPIPITVNAKPQQPTTEQPTTQQPTTEQPTTQAPPAAQPSAEGTVLSPQETGEKAEFTVTSDDSADPTVAYKETTEKKEKSVTIPNTVEVNGVTYKVTSIADNAFKGNKTVTKVTVGSNITSIGKNAFANCKKLKTVTVSKNVTDVGDNAFKGCTALTKVTLPAKTKKIGKNAFSGCKKLKTLTIKSKDLTSKTVSKNAFKGITGKTTIKVPASKLAAYKKLFKKKGLAKNVKVTR